MQLNYENIYLINGEKIKSTTLSQEKKLELTKELESKLMQSLECYPVSNKESSSFFL